MLWKSVRCSEGLSQALVCIGLLLFSQSLSGCIPSKTHYFDVRSLQQSADDDSALELPLYSNMGLSLEVPTVTYFALALDIELEFTNDGELSFEVPTASLRVSPIAARDKQWAGPVAVDVYRRTLEHDLAGKYEYSDEFRERVRNVYSYEREGHKRTPFEPHGRPTFYPDLKTMRIQPGEKVTITTRFHTPEFHDGILELTLISSEDGTVYKLCYKMDHVKSVRGPIL